MPFIHTVNVRGKASALRTDQLKAAVAAVEAAPKNYSRSWRNALRDELNRRQSRHVVEQSAWPFPAKLLDYPSLPPAAKRPPQPKPVLDQLPPAPF